MHDIVQNANEELPGYLSILRNEDESLFSDSTFQLTDPRLNVTLSRLKQKTNSDDDDSRIIGFGNLPDPVGR
jgi:hypothetical protein